jgi:hypothetical protein
VIFPFQLLDHTLADITPGSDVVGIDGQLEVHLWSFWRKWLKRWAKNPLTTENTEATEKIQENLRVLCGLCGEFF